MKSTVANCAYCRAEFTPTRGPKATLAKNPDARVYCRPECRSAGVSATKTHIEPVQSACGYCNAVFTLTGGQSWKLRTGKATEFCCSRVCASKLAASRPDFAGMQRTEAAREKASASQAARLLADVRVDCLHCNTNFVLPKAARSELRAGRQSAFYCSRSCKSRGIMAAPGHQQRMIAAASEARREVDFLNTHEAIAKRTASLKASGKLAGGLAIGRTAPKPQAVLAEALGRPMEYKVLSRLPRSEGYKACYHIDIAIPESMIAIEVDGRDHQWRVDVDRKKDGVLEGLGWKVVRFTNQQVLQDLTGCVQAVRCLEEQRKAA